MGTDPATTLDNIPPTVGFPSISCPPGALPGQVEIGNFERAADQQIPAKTHTGKLVGWQIR